MQILPEIERGDPAAAKQLLPPVYDERRKFVENQLAHEKPGQGYDAKAHESFLKSVQEYIRPIPVSRDTK
jgi:hypothetical protein